MKFCTIDGIVGGDMQIIKVCRNLVILWNIIEYGLYRRGDRISVSKSLGLFQCLLSPHSCLKVSGLVLKEVHSNIEETHARSAAKEYHFIILRNVQKFLPKSATLVHHSLPLLGSVRDRDNRDTCSLEILQCLNGIVNSLLRENARTRCEIMYFFHNQQFQLKYALCVRHLFAEMAQKRNFLALSLYCESCLDRLVVCYTFRIHASCYSDDFLRHINLLFLDHLEVADHIYCSIRSEKGKFVELVVLKELVLDLDDAFLSVSLARKVDTDGNLIFNTLEVKDAECLIYVFRRNMVQNGTVFQCAYY